MNRVVGNGSSTHCWLFSLSNQMESMVDKYCERVWDSWIWSFSWRRDLFQWEFDLVAQLREHLELVELPSEADTWRWTPGFGGNFIGKLYL
jgi:hypothetical protein